MILIFNIIRIIYGRGSMNTNYIIYSISKLKKAMQVYLDQALKKEGIDDVVPAYADILTALYTNEGRMKMHEISDQIGKDKSTVTVLVNKLIERNYIYKEKSTLDKRVIYIYLDQKAIDLTDSFYRIADDVRSLAYKDFTEEEILEFKSYMNRIYKNFSEVNND